MDLFVGLIVVLGASALEWVTTRTLARRLRWQETGRCMSCGYDLRGTPGRCPECGAQVSPMSRVYLHLLSRQREKPPEPSAAVSAGAKRPGSETTLK
jgi:predicted amidophosphoribosyltransferase